MDAGAVFLARSLVVFVLISLYYQTWLRNLVTANSNAFLGIHHLGMGQNRTASGPQGLVFCSIYHGSILGRHV